eukprot:1160716-Pelagomonas_calceolata.AAC.4
MHGAMQRTLSEHCKGMPVLIILWGPCVSSLHAVAVYAPTCRVPNLASRPSRVVRKSGRGGLSCTGCVSRRVLKQCC